MGHYAMQITSLAYDPGAYDPSGVFEGFPIDTGPVTSGGIPFPQQQDQQTQSGTVPAVRIEHSAFGEDIFSRLEASLQFVDTGEDVETGAQKDPAQLATELTSAIDFIGQRHGDGAAAAAMGMVLKGIGNGQVTEQSLGDGLLNVLRFVDRNFGVDAGNTMLAQFNGGLNTAMNDFFDNGLDEIFYAGPPAGPQPATDPASAGLVSALPGVLDQIEEMFGQQTRDNALETLRASLEQGDSLRTGLGKVIGQIGEEFGSEAARELTAFLDNAVATLPVSSAASAAPLNPANSANSANSAARTPYTMPPPREGDALMQKGHALDITV